jgi:hypothetical protein
LITDATMNSQIGNAPFPLLNHDLSAANHSSGLSPLDSGLGTPD